MSDFSLEAYRAMVEAFFQRGYEARSFADADPAKRHLIVRHDLDMSIQTALPLAELERALGLSAVYFVLLRTELYNPLSAAGTRDLKRLIELGHAVGLHFNASLYPADRAGLDLGAAAECTALEAIVGRSVTVISLHRPGKSAQGELICGTPGTLGGRRHADEPLYFHDMGYCSDSRGGWHYGHPLDHRAVSEGRALQLLTHPVWWMGSSAEPAGKLAEFLDQRFQFLDQELAANCLVHKPGRWKQ